MEPRVRELNYTSRTDSNPFFNNLNVKHSIAKLMELLDYDGTNPALTAEKKDFQIAVNAWMAHPFNPHLIARTRLAAYQKTAVMK